MEQTFPRDDVHTALLLGASGLVGAEVLSILKSHPRYERVVVVTRRDLGAVVEHPRVQQIVVDFDVLERYAEELIADHVFCAFGTTIKKAGTRVRFHQVDYEYPRRVAQCTRNNGAQVFVLVSALGASTRSRFFYSRVKGELESALQAMAWPRLVIVRPSIIAGERTERRFLERLGQMMLRAAPRSFRPVHASDIAAAMVNLATDERDGVRVVNSGKIERLSAMRS